MIKKFATFIFVFSFALVMNVSSVFAHTTVKPTEAGIGSFTDFSIGVPSEKEVSTVKAKLILPEGLIHVTPVVKSGWRINTVADEKAAKSETNGEEHPALTAIEWAGGEIPGEQKDFFQFSAQVPNIETELVWRIEQTYADGSVTSWSIAAENEQPKDSNGRDDFSKFGPASKTKVINDLKSKTENTDNAADTENTSGQLRFLMILSFAALGLSASAIAMQLRKNK